MIPASVRYADIRSKMMPGDLLAFGGKGPGISGLIKRITRAPVSHVGVVLQTKVADQHPDSLRYFNLVVESTSLDGKAGVVTSRVSSRVETYNGDLWWLPLSAQSHANLNRQAFFDFLFRQEGKPYDYLQAPLSVLDRLDWTGLTRAQEDFDRFFCSELVAAGWEAGGLLKDVNASEFTPIDCCRLRVFSSHYYQLKGAETEIPRWNTVDPETFRA